MNRLNQQTWPRGIRWLLAALLALATTGCAELPRDEPASTRLFVFDCGVLYFEDVTMFNLSNEETDVRELFVPCYLIEHENGRLLWDGGLPKVFADGEGRQSMDGGFAQYDRWIVDQLADMDLTPADIDMAAFSHLHFDHAGAANFFAESKILMQRAEWDAAFNSGNPFVDSSMFDGLKEAEVELLDGDLDVFGDGSVRLIYTPGHTPGHQSILIQLENTGPVVLTGDLYHFRANRRLRRPPNFNSDPAQTLESMARIEALLEETGATLWIEHDMALARTLRKAPAFYD